MEVVLQMYIMNFIGHGKHCDNGNCMKNAATVYGCVYAPDSAALDYQDCHRQWYIIIYYIYTVSDSMSARIPATPKHVGAGLFQKDGNTCWMAETLSNMPWQRSQLWICTAFYFVLLHNISSTCQRNRSRNRESTLMQLSHPATAKNCWVLELDRRCLYKFQIYSRFTNKLVKRLQDTILRAYCVPCTTKLAGPDL